MHALTGKRAVHIVSSIAATAVAIISVAIQPRTFSFVVMTNRPMIPGRAAISIITAMTGTEMTPLMTALQYSALNGSTGVKPSAMPIKVETAMTP